MTAFDRWHKKYVLLTWNAQETRFAVAQELFSSHAVDVGSRLLLRSLDLAELSEQGEALDFGCGYGVLGLALRERMPGWRVTLIDRDALAIKFSQANAASLHLDDGSVRCRVGLGPDSAPNGGWDLVLWNVPGKAGEPVIGRLASAVAGSLAAGGLAALVVVNPLSDLVRESLCSDPEVSVVHDTTHSEHTVIHARRGAPGSDRGDPFDCGVFDREPASFGVDDFDYDLVPVFGIPEYDSYGFATELVFDLLHTVDHARSILVQQPGQGHIPLVAAQRYRPNRLMLVDRDQLALRASIRAIVAAGPRVRRLEIAATPDPGDLPVGSGFDLAIVSLEDQIRNEIQIARLADLAKLVVPGGSLMMAGNSAMASRAIGFAAKSVMWKLRERVKRSGASAVRFQRVVDR